jgi:hypothetical protein
MTTYVTRRSGFDRDAARRDFEEAQSKRCGTVRVGDKVTLSDHPTAQIYTVTEVNSVDGFCHKYFVAHLMYVSEYGKQCSAGAVDVSSLMMPTAEQMKGIAV